LTGASARWKFTEDCDHNRDVAAPARCSDHSCLFCALTPVSEVACVTECPSLRDASLCLAYRPHLLRCCSHCPPRSGQNTRAAKGRRCFHCSQEVKASIAATEGIREQTYPVLSDCSHPHLASVRPAARVLPSAAYAHPVLAETPNRRCARLAATARICWCHVL
jgi:hypothetical protein